jgi:hypothetical protein
MNRPSRKKLSVAIATAAAFLLSTSAFAQQDNSAAQGSTQTQPTEKHHSKAKGALVGGAGGAVVGGKKGAAVGAAGGALVQHHKNKKAEKKAEKAAEK